VLEIAGRQILRCPGAVGGDDVHVLGAIEDPVLSVESAEESLDLPRCLPRLVQPDTRPRLVGLHVDRRNDEGDTVTVG
jgi:hypothetical protein